MKTTLIEQSPLATMSLTSFLVLHSPSNFPRARFLDLWLVRSEFKLQQGSEILTPVSQQAAGTTRRQMADQALKNIVKAFRPPPGSNPNPAANSAAARAAPGPVRSDRQAGSEGRGGPAEGSRPGGGTAGGAGGVRGSAAVVKGGTGAVRPAASGGGFPR